MAQIGKISTLRVNRIATPGVFLDGGPLGEILLPGRYVPRGTLPGEALDVFIHFDSEDRIVATTETPLAQVGQFASLRVVSLHPRTGAFLAWGLSKDLLLPLREQTQPLRIGDSVVIHVSLDERSQRLIASARVEKYLSPTPPSLRIGAAVDLLIYAETELGYKCIAAQAHSGLLYRSDLARPLHPGESRTGFVRHIRPDGKIDLSPEPLGYARIGPLAEKILATLRTRGGRLPYGDDTPPDTIRAVFGTSKKAFKQAIGSLLRARLVSLRDNCILISNTNPPPSG